MDTFDIAIVVLLSLWAVYACFRIALGRIRYKRAARGFEQEGVLLSQRRVFTRFNFPMIKRITFTRIVLTRRRFVALHWCSLNQVLQAPVGPKNLAGTENGTFEAEKRGTKTRLLLRTTLRGSGKIRFHVPNAKEWVDAIREC
jgi:hypothetical protein